MAKHTPGPWWVEIDTSDDAAWCNKWPKIMSEDGEIVGTEGLYSSIERDMANAKLIAAAPDLLEFAEEVRRSGDTRLASMAIAVINKAKGN